MAPILSIILSFPYELLSGSYFPIWSDRSASQRVMKVDAPTVASNSHHTASQKEQFEASSPADDWKWVTPMGAAPPYAGIKIGSRKHWVVTCDSELDPVNNGCGNTIDGNRDTHWLARRQGDYHKTSTITVDLGETTNVNGVAVLPRQDGKPEGNIAKHEVYVSADGKDWSSPVAYGIWWKDRTEKLANFETTPARFLRLVANSDSNGTDLIAIAEINVYYRPVDTVPQQSTKSPSGGSLGVWGKTLNLPIVPVSAWVDPNSYRVVLLSSKRHDAYPQDEPAWTLTAYWDLANDDVSQATVEHTDHNMFCPGMAFDADGRLIITGGASGTKTTIYDGRERHSDISKLWQEGEEMDITRGYHAAVLMPDNRMFVLGGSWGARALVKPKERNKIGEIYDPKANSWTTLRGCPADVLWTNDLRRDKKDNHLWLFTWANNTVFQAGPSKNMHWYTVTGNGGYKPAGTRTPDDGFTDDDAMCGEAVMYDATQGKIVTFGGASSYEKGDPASNRAHIITLGAPNSSVEVERVAPMAYNRTFASAIVVPNGDVFVAGGQHGIPAVFTDKNPVLHAEIFSPKTKKWTTLAANSIVRPYHSWTILLPDARIMNGGGGLCGDACDANHFDAQTYTPPYLLTEDGQERARPVIINVSSDTAELADLIQFVSDTEIHAASMIRYGSTTHAVNTDQRRIPLKLDEWKPPGTPREGAYTYQFKVPEEPHVAIPGYWMLFVLDKEETPSVAKNIKILPAL